MSSLIALGVITNTGLSGALTIASETLPTIHLMGVERPCEARTMMVPGASRARLTIDVAGRP